MKAKYIVLLFTLGYFGNTSLAQRTPPQFNPVEAAGLIKYDSDKVIRKLKIQEDSIKRMLSTHIHTYNQEIDQLLLTQGNALQELENDFDRNVKIAFQNRDPSQMDGVKYKINQIIPPIRYEVSEFEKVLNASLAQILTEEENKKWLKYQKRQKPNSRNF